MNNEAQTQETKKKTFVLDTNVLLHDANSIFSFKDNHLVVPIESLEELDSFKSRQDEVGRNARLISRNLDRLRVQGNLADGIALESGGTIRIATDDLDMGLLPSGMQSDKIDNRILALVLTLSRRSHQPVILVTKDINLRVKADAIGLQSEDYETNRVNLETLYSGTAEFVVPRDVVDNYYKTKEFDPPKNEEGESDLYANQFVMLVDEGNPDHTALGQYSAIDRKVIPLKHSEDEVWGIHALNKEQRYAFELLLNDEISLVSLVGIAGTGKTLLALAAGLERTVNQTKYSRLLISRPIVPVGKDIGYLPGDVEEKLMPRMQPISDNLEFLFTANGGEAGNFSLADLIEDGIIELEPLTYIRGRSIPNQYMIVDEAQNLTPLELKTIITRAGKGTKIVLTGDPNQIDHPYLDSQSNGLTYVVERFKGEKIYGHVTFHKGERSDLAELAARVM